MKIRSISYERLFNLHDFNNEKFRFEAELGEGEDPRNSMAELAGYVIDLHEIFEIYRKGCMDLSHLTEQLSYEATALERTEKQIHEQQKQIHEMRARGKDEYEIACFVKSLRELREDKAQKEKNIKDIEAKIKIQMEIVSEIREKLKKGTLFKGSEYASGE